MTEQPECSLFAPLFEAAPVGIGLLDGELRVLQTNAEFPIEAGFARDSAVGQPLRRLSPSLAAGLEDHCREVLNTGSPIRNVELLTNGPRGCAKHWLASVYPIGPGVALILRDVTDLRNTQAKLREAEVSQEIGQLAAGVAHDFNNLLTTILGHATVVLETLPPDTVYVQCQQDVINAAKRAAELTSQLLAFAGKGFMMADDLDLSRTICDFEPQLRGLAAPHALCMRLHCDLPRISAEAEQIRQLLAHLVANGAEAIPHHARGVITVSTGMECRDGRQFIHLTVTDTGSGIDDATLPRIFEPFFSTKFLGRGLGLAAVQGIVRRHNGVIEVNSTLGSGTAFNILFPLPEKTPRQIADAPAGLKTV